MITTQIARANAALLMVSGIALFFVPDVILPGFAGIYGWLLLLGPIERDLQTYRRSLEKE